MELTAAERNLLKSAFASLERDLTDRAAFIDAEKAMRFAEVQLEKGYPLDPQSMYVIALSVNKLVDQNPAQADAVKALFQKIGLVEEELRAMFPEINPADIG